MAGEPLPGFAAVAQGWRRSRRIAHPHLWLHTGASTAGGTVRSRLQRKVAASPMAAVKDNHKPGAAGLPVIWMRYVQMAGVKPPNSAAARLYARENPAARASAGISSVRYTTM